jgi:hypothetical protein
MKQKRAAVQCRTAVFALWSDQEFAVRSVLKVKLQNYFTIK